MNLSIHRIHRIFEKCHEIAKDSHDPKTQVGACLVHKSSRSSVAEGFNGFVRGAADRSLPDQAPEKYRYMIHAEMNVILNAFKTGAVKYDPKDYVLFCTLSPCENCARFLLNVGIDEVYFEKLHSSFETYRQGTEHLSPAKDIEGILKTYVQFPGGYVAREDNDTEGPYRQKEVKFYKVYIGPIK